VDVPRDRARAEFKEERGTWAAVQLKELVR